MAKEYVCEIRHSAEDKNMRILGGLVSDMCTKIRQQDSNIIPKRKLPYFLHFKVSPVVLEEFNSIELFPHASDLV